MKELSPFILMSLNGVLAALLVALIFALIRLLRGPSLEDLVVAIDLVTTIMMGIILLYLFVLKETVLLDAVGVLALISFLGTVAYGIYLKKGKPHA